jgi:hypothetical protein
MKPRVLFNNHLLQAFTRPSPIIAMLRGFRLGGRRLRLHRELIQVPLDALGVAAHLGAMGGVPSMRLGTEKYP